MKIIYKLLLSASILITLNSCNDFLNIKPTDVLTEDLALITTEDFNAAVNACYSGLGGGGYYGGNFIAIGEMPADNLKFGLANAGQGQFLYNLNFTVEADEPSGFFISAYNVIYRVNLILSKLDAMTGTQAEKNQIRGEVLFLRALSHHDLIRAFSYRYKHTTDASHLGVSIKLLPNVDKPSRNSVKQVYDQIYKDLDEAETLLQNANFPIRATKLAVLAFKSRLSLYQEDWALAETTATNAINVAVTSAPLATGTTYTDMWTRTSAGAETSGESIFKIRRVQGNTAMGTTFFNMAAPTDYFMPNADAIGLYTETTDIRKNAFIGTTTVAPRPTIKKFQGITAQPGLVDIKVFRTSELYLNRAEALFAQGKETEARNDLNLVAAARGAALIPNTTTGNNLQDAIRNERRREFLYEGGRRFDLHRWQVNMVRSDFNGASSAVQLPFSNFRSVYAIPQSERFANPNAEQNPGW